MEGVEGMEALQGSRSRKSSKEQSSKALHCLHPLHCRPSNGKVQITVSAGWGGDGRERLEANADPDVQAIRLLAHKAALLQHQIEHGLLVRIANASRGTPIGVSVVHRLRTLLGIGRFFAALVNEGLESVHVGTVFRSGLSHDLRNPQSMLLPQLGSLDCPPQDSGQLSVQFIGQVFVIL